MSRLSKVVAALPFAHLLGMAATAKAEGDEEMDRRDGESDEDYARRMEDKEDEEKEAEEKAKKAKKAKKAEDADGDEDAQGVDESDEDYAQRMEDKEEDEEKAKKAKKAEDDESDKEKAARRSERARCAAIFKCSAAGVRPDVAAHLAFSTSMSTAEAVSMLTTVAAGGAMQPRSLASRMAGVKTPNVGAGGVAAPAAGSSADVAAKIIAAGKVRRGEA